MNPYDVILCDYYTTRHGHPTIKTELPTQGDAGATVLVLKILAANYTGGWDGVSNPYRYALSVLEQYGPCTLLDYMKAAWNSKAGR